MRDGARRVGPVLALASLSAALFHEVVFSGRALYERDLHILLYGQLASFARTVAQGSWPLWNPYIGFGRPMLANPGAQALYPWTYLALVLPPWTAYGLTVVSHLFLSGLGLYLLARQLDLSRGAALVGAGLWMTSGPLLSLVNLWQHFAAAAWMPWILLAADRALAAPSRRRALAWGALLTAQVLSGSVDVCAMSILLAGAFTLLRHSRWTLLRQRITPRQALGLLIALAFPLGLSALQWLPSLEMLLSSGRSTSPEGMRTFWSLHPAALAQWLVPVFPSDLPLQKPVRDLLFDGREPLLASLYVGLAGLPLVVASFAGARRRLALFGAGVVAAAALAALGRHAPFLDLALTCLPPLRILRFPAKAMVVAAFAWCLLAALGLEAVRSGAFTRSTRWPVLAALPGATGAMLLGLGLWGLRFRAEAIGSALLVREPASVSFARRLEPLAPHLAATASLAAVTALLAFAARRWRGGAWALAGAAVLDLFLAHRNLNRTMPSERLAEKPATLAVLAGAATSRVYSFEETNPRLLGRSYRHRDMSDAYRVPSPEDWPDHEGQALGLEAYLFADIAARWGLFGSYGVDALGLQPAFLHNLTLVFRASEETPEYVRLLRLGAVDTVLALHGEGLEELEPVAVVAGRFREPIRVFRVLGTLPRTYAVARVHVARAAMAYRALVGEAFDPRHEVVLPDGPAREGETGFRGEARLLKLLPDRVEIAARMSQPGYVVLVDAWDPGWRATVDGHAAPVLRANVAFRAVPVPAGDHLVEMVYRPTAVLWGLLLSAASALVGLLALGRRGSEPRPSKAMAAGAKP